MSFLHTNKSSGLSLIEMLIAIAVFTLVFMGLLGMIQYTSKVVMHSSMRLSALSLANDRMEYFRSLPYDDVGTISGIPNGLIPQNSTTTLNSLEFSERVLVEYVDDPADGLLTATTTDSNGIPADYKRIKVEISWTIAGETKSIFLLSNIVPRSIETTDGGGSVRINVIDSLSMPLSGAEVRLVNNTTTSTIDVIKYSDATGVALFSGAPAASNYEVTVTAPNYSTDQTLAATTSIPFPTTVPFAVLEADISTLTFQIDELSDINFQTYSAVVDNSVVEEFTDMSGMSTSTNIAVAAGRAELTDTAGVYDSSGSFLLASVTPATIAEWKTIVMIGDMVPNTNIWTRFYTGTSSIVLIPDSDLPGNSAGFNSRFIDVSMLDVVNYPEIIVGITLETTDTAVTPSVDGVGVYYRESTTALGGVDMNIKGIKTIGTALDASPIFKFDTDITTDGGGYLFVPDVEFDTYTITNLDGLTVAHACPQIPLIHLAGVDSDVELELVSAGTNTLRVSIEDINGNYVPGASVTLSRTGYSVTVESDTCGQAFFSTGVVASSDYTLEVTRNGYTTNTVTPYDLNGESSLAVTLSES